ncbi:hypothetical protein V6N13_122432 [Hibiscus sabdariffa]
MNVHQISRGKQKACKERVGELVSMIHGTDESYLKVNWNKRTELVTKAMEKLKDPHFVLEMFESLLQPIISGHDVRKAETALQELQSILKQSNNTVLNQDGGNEIHNSNPSHFTQIEDIQNPHEWMLMTKEESHSINEELNQIMAILEKKGQLMKNVNVCLIIAKMLQKVVCSCSTIAHCILDQNIGNQVQGCHGDGSVTYDRNKGQLRLIFPPTPVLDQEEKMREAVRGQGAVFSLFISNNIPCRMDWRLLKSISQLFAKVLDVFGTRKEKKPCDVENTCIMLA